jgi:hypothetical protein
LRSAQPKKKRRFRAAFPKKIVFWYLSTLSLEPILRKNAKKHKPRRLAGVKRPLRPARKPFALFFEIYPAEIFWKRKRDFSVGSPAINGRGGVAR